MADAAIRELTLVRSIHKILEVDVLDIFHPYSSSWGGGSQLEGATDVAANSGRISRYDVIFRFVSLRVPWRTASCCRCFLTIRIIPVRINLVHMTTRATVMPIR